MAFTGSGANVIGLQSLLRPFEAVICAETAHINVDECGAPERFLGSKLVAVPTPEGKLTPELVAAAAGGVGDEHHVQPKVISITQATELGTCYRLEEIAALAGETKNAAAPLTGGSAAAPSALIADLSFGQLCKIGLAMTWPLLIVALTALGIFAAILMRK